MTTVHHKKLAHKKEATKQGHVNHPNVTEAPGSGHNVKGGGKTTSQACGKANPAKAE